MASPRRILITGVSRGLGRALVERFVERGHTVLGCARDAEALEALAERHGEPHAFAPVDVADDASVASWAGDLLSRGPAPDLVVNNAATIHRNAVLWDLDAPEFDRVLRVNVSGTVNVLRAFVPALIERGSGMIANFSSGWGRSTAPDVSGYCASKWAIEGLTQSLAQELPGGVGAVAVNPGIIDTEMLRSCFGDAAGGYPDAQAWSHGAADFLLSLAPAQSGRALTIS